MSAELCPACSQFHRDCLASHSNILRYPTTKPLIWGERRPICSLGAFIYELESHWSQGHRNFLVKNLKFEGICHMPRTDGKFSPDSDDFLGELRRNPAIVPDFSSETSIARLQEWLHECDTKPWHGICRQRERVMPSRVIDLMGPDEEQQVKLIETAGLMEDYVVLSHCWGSSEKFITTTSTLLEAQSGINIGSLPKTFRDAIWLTRNIGKRYLWIDSLCIVQDDGKDWLVESKEMSRIYSNSYLSVAASNASDDKDGFLQPYKEHQFLVIKPPWEDSKYVYVQDRTFKTWQDFYYNERSKEWEKIRDIGGLASGLPLDRRGWTLQEAFLPHRAVRYGFYNMDWACRYCHGDATGLWNDFWHLKTELHWRKMVEQYTRRRLTFEKDKLPAISGLAKMFANQSNKSYCAGLWWDGIGGDLLWRRDKSSFLVKPQGRLGPSWSWASFDGRIDFTLTNINPYTMVYESKFIEFTTVLGTENPYGEVESGSITLEGPLLVEFDDDNASNNRDRFLQQTVKRFDLAQVSREEVFELVILRTTDWVVSASLIADPTGPTVRATLHGILVVEVKGSPDTFARVGYWSRKFRACPESLEVLEIFRRKILLV